MVPFFGGLLVPFHGKGHVADTRPTFFVGLSDAIMRIRVDGQLIGFERFLQARLDTSTSLAISKLPVK